MTRAGARVVPGRFWAPCQEAKCQDGAKEERTKEEEAQEEAGAAKNGITREFLRPRRAMEWNVHTHATLVMGDEIGSLVS